MLDLQRVARSVGLAVVAVALGTGVASAQSSGVRTATVPFRGAVSEDGYASASAGMAYSFIVCQSEIHIAYSLNPGSASLGSSYMFGGKAYPASGSPPQLNSVHFAGTVYRGPSPIGSFSDGFAGKALGMGCFSGQTQKIANVADVVGTGASAAQIGAYLNGLSVQVQPGEVLRSASQESAIRSQLRRAEADARKAEQDANAKAQREAERQAQAQRAVAAQQNTQASAPAPYSAGQSGSVPTPQRAPAPPLTREQRISNAIASDKVLADERQAKQRALYAQQQADLAAAQQRQNEALIAATPAVMEMAGSINDSLEAWDARKKARAYNNAQAAMAGKCLLANGMAAPKDGTIQLGVELRANLSKADCGYNPANRYKAFLLDLPEARRLRFTIGPASWHVFTSYQIDVRDVENKQYMFLGWQEWGSFPKSNSKTVELPAGVYVVQVTNGVQGIFMAFDLNVDPVDANGNPMIVAPPVASATAAVATASSEATQAKPAAVPGKAYVGVSLAPADDEGALVTAVDPNGPAAAAGVRAGDKIWRLQSDRAWGFLTDVILPKDQAELETWLAKVRAGAQATIFYRRNGQNIDKNFQLGRR